ncbi:lysozyme c-1 [Culicoides brevitarsis]|uniref:lysozyme c-1 n=1 Tax=Culicoides brevitarsis TaxID=469753 RepID=UPI00307C8C59
MKMTIKFLIFLYFFAYYVEGKEYTRCEVAKTLAKNSFPRSFLPNWVCLVEAESGRSSNKITEYSNYKSYGLFQINSKEYCKPGKKGGLCGMKCEDFLKDDIKSDIECAKTIYSRKGFDGWPGWQRKCKGKQLPDISKCVSLA